MVKFKNRQSPEKKVLKIVLSGLLPARVHFHFDKKTVNVKFNIDSYYPCKIPTGSRVQIKLLVKCHPSCKYNNKPQR